MVWAGISYYGKTRLINIGSGSVDSKKYQQVLDEALESIQDAFPNGMEWIFQQDGARPHTSASTRDWLEKNQFNVLSPWPANSPDLNPIENLWKRLKENVYRRKFTTLDGLFRVAQEEWQKIGDDEIKKLVMSVPNRLAQVIERNGRHADY